MSDTIRILIIEDNPAMLTLTRDLLTSENFNMVENFEIDTATNGAEGREKLEKNPPDLLILDLSLPDDFGLDICTDIKKDHPQVLIFVLTALGNSQDIVNGFESGADDYLAKPYNKREFIARVQLLLRRANKIK